MALAYGCGYRKPHHSPLAYRKPNHGLMANSQWSIKKWLLTRRLSTIDYRPLAIDLVTFLLLIVIFL